MSTAVSSRSAAEVHRALKDAVSAWEQAEHNAVVGFAEVQERRLYRDLGYSSIHQYAREALNFSDTRTGDFVRLARKLSTLPVLKEAVARGLVGYTKAREVIRVASPRTESRWVDEAQKCSRTDLAARVKKVREKAEARRRRNPDQAELLPTPADVDDTTIREVPVRVTFDMTPEQYARYEKLQVKLAALGFANPLEAVLESLAGTLDRAKESDDGNCAVTAPRGAPVQVVVHHCPECGKTAIPTARGELAVSAKEFDRLKEDAQVFMDGGKNTSAIPPGVRNRVLARDRNTCTAPGCRNTGFLHVHHLVPRELGGGNDLQNLVTLCSGCHRLAHEKRRVGA